MATYTALMDIKVDTSKAKTGIENLEKNLGQLNKTSDKSSKSLSNLEKQTTSSFKRLTESSQKSLKSFRNIEKTILSVNGKLGKSLSAFNKVNKSVESVNKSVKTLNTTMSKGVKAFADIDKSIKNVNKTAVKNLTALKQINTSVKSLRTSISGVIKPMQTLTSRVDKFTKHALSNMSKMISQVNKANDNYIKLVRKLYSEKHTLHKALTRANQALSQQKSQIGQLISQVNRLEKAFEKLKKAQEKVQKSTKDSSSLFEKFNKLLGKHSYLFSVLASAVLSFIKINLVGYLIRVTDQFILIENRVRLVNSATIDFTNNMEAVKQIAFETRQSLFAVANLYSRVGRNSKELAKDTIALSTTVSTISKSFQIAGATAEEARNAIVQLSQALASGRLQGDELRSILELAPTLANSISKSLGISLGSLRTFASQGLITTKIITAAVRENAEEIDKEFRKIVPTISQGLQNISTGMQILFGENERIQIANNKLALSFMRLGEALSNFSKSKVVDEFGKFLNFVIEKVVPVAAGIAVVVAALAGFAAIAASVVGAILLIKKAIAGVTALFAAFSWTLTGIVTAGLPIVGIVTAIGLALTAGYYTYKAFDEAINGVSFSLKDSNKIMEEAAQKTKDLAEKEGEVATAAQITAAQITALRAEYSKGVTQLQAYRTKVKELNLDIAENNALVAEGSFLWGEFFREFGQNTALYLDEAIKTFNQLFRFLEFFRKKENMPKWMGGTQDGPFESLYKSLFGENPDEEKSRYDKLIENLEKQLETLKKRIDELTGGDSGKKAADMLLEEFEKRLARTTKLVASESEMVRNRLQQTFLEPLNIRIQTTQANLDDLASNVSRAVETGIDQSSSFKASLLTVGANEISTLLSNFPGIKGRGADKISNLVLDSVQKGGGGFEQFLETAPIKAIFETINKAIEADPIAKQKREEDAGGEVTIFKLAVKNEVIKALGTYFDKELNVETELQKSQKTKLRDLEHQNKLSLINVQLKQDEAKLVDNGYATFLAQQNAMTAQHNAELEFLRETLELKGMQGDLYDEEIRKLSTAQRYEENILRAQRQRAVNQFKMQQQDALQSATLDVEAASNITERFRLNKNAGKLTTDFQIENIEFKERLRAEREIFEVQLKRSVLSEGERDTQREVFKEIQKQQWFLFTALHANKQLIAERNQELENTAALFAIENQIKATRRENELVLQNKGTHEAILESIEAEFEEKERLATIENANLNLGKLQLSLELSGLETQKQKNIELEKEKQKRVAIDRLLAQQDKNRDLDNEFALLQLESQLLDKRKNSYTVETQVRALERTHLMELKRLELERDNIKGDDYNKELDAYKIQLDTEDVIKRQNKLLDQQRYSAEKRLDLAALQKTSEAELFNLRAQNRWGVSFANQENLGLITQYNQEVVKLAQNANVQLNQLKFSTEIWAEYGFNALELKKGATGIDEDSLNNLRDQVKELKKILGLQLQINDAKAQESPSIPIALINEFFPDAGKKGTFENIFFETVEKNFSQYQQASQNPLVEMPGSGAMSFFAQGGEAAGAGADGILGSLSGGFDSLGNAFQAGMDGLGAAFESGMGVVAIAVWAAKKLLEEILNNETTQMAIKDFMNDLMPIFSETADGIAVLIAALGALVKPIMGVFDLIGGFIRAFLKSFVRLLEPIGRLVESIQPVIIVIGMTLQTFMMFLNQIFGIFEDLFDKIAELIGGPVEDGYKSLVLLRAERDAIMDINTSLEGVADVLQKIDDVLFDIVNSSLNLAAPSIKLENAAQKYDELYQAATQFGAGAAEMDEFTSFAKDFLGQAQDVMKSSKTYQDIYDSVIKDIMSVGDYVLDEIGDNITTQLQKSTFDLTLMGSDLGAALDALTDQYRNGTVTFGELTDYISLKLRQIEEDIELRDLAYGSEFGAYDVGASFEAWQKMRGAAISSTSLQEDLDAIRNSGASSEMVSAVLGAYAEYDATTAYDATTTSGRSTSRGPTIGDIEQPTSLPGTVDNSFNNFDLTSIDATKIIGNLAQWILDALAHALGQIVGTFGELLNYIAKPINDIVGTFGEWLASVVTPVIDKLIGGEFEAFIREFFEGLFGTIGNGEFEKLIVGFFEGLWAIIEDPDWGKFLENFFGGLFTALGNLASKDFLEGLFQFVPNIAIAAVDFLEALMKPLETIVVDVLHYLFGNSPTGLFGPIQKMAAVDVMDFLEGIFTPIAGITADIGDWIDAAIVQPLAKMGDLDIADWVENVLYNPVKNLGVGLIDYFTAILYPILSIGEVDFAKYIATVLYPVANMAVDAVEFLQGILEPIFSIGDIGIVNYLREILSPITDLTADFGTFLNELLDPIFGDMTADASLFLTKILEPITKLVLDPLKYLFGNSPTGILAPIQDLVGKLIPIDFLMEVLKPITDLIGKLDPIAFLTALLKPIEDITGLDVTQLLDALLAPLQDLATLDLQDWIDTVIVEPLSKLTGGDFADVLAELVKPIQSLTGGSFEQVLAELVKPIQNLTGGSFEQVLTELVKPIQNLTGGSFDKVLTELVKPIQNLTGGSFDVFLDAILSPIQDLAGGDITGYLEFALRPILDLTGMSIDDLLSYVTKPIQAIAAGDFQGYLTALLKPIQDLTGNFTTFLNQIFEPIDKLTGGTFSQFLEALLKPITDLTVDGGAFLAELMKPITKLILDPLVYLFGNSPTGILAPITDLVGKILSADFLKGILEPLTSLGVNVGDFLTKILEPITKLVPDAGDFLEKVLKSIGNLILSPVDFLRDILKPITNLVPGLDDFLDKILGPITKLTADYGQVIQKLLDAIFKGEGYDIGTFLQDILDMAMDYVTGAFDLAKWAGEQVGNLFNFTAVTDLAKWAGDQVSKLFNFSSTATNLTTWATDNISKIFNFSSSAKNLTSWATDNISKVFNFSSSATNLTSWVSDRMSSIFNFGSSIDLGSWIGDKLSSLTAKVFNGIPLLPNPFYQFGLGPEYLLSFAKGGEVPKYDSGGFTGGYLKGPSHANGGIKAVINGSQPIEMEGGEYVIRKKAVEAIGLDKLAVINHMDKNKDNMEAFHRMVDQNAKENYKPGPIADMSVSRALSVMSKADPIGYATAVEKDRAGATGGKFHEGGPTPVTGLSEHVNYFRRNSAGDFYSTATNMQYAPAVKPDRVGQAGFNVVDFDISTGGTIEQILGKKGVKLDVNFPGAFSDLSSVGEVYGFGKGGYVPKFHAGGSVDFTEENSGGAKSMAEGSNSISNLVRSFSAENYALGKAQLDIGVKDFFREPVFNAKYTPPEWLPEEFVQIVEGIGSAIQYGVDVISSVISSITATLQNLVQNIINNITSLITNAVQSAVTTVTNWIWSLFGGSSSTSTSTRPLTWQEVYDLGRSIINEINGTQLEIQTGAILRDEVSQGMIQHVSDRVDRLYSFAKTLPDDAARDAWANENSYASTGRLGIVRDDMTSDELRGRPAYYGVQAARYRTSESSQPKLERFFQEMKEMIVGGMAVRHAFAGYDGYNTRIGMLNSNADTDPLTSGWPTNMNYSSSGGQLSHFYPEFNFKPSEETGDSWLNSLLRFTGYHLSALDTFGRGISYPEKGTPFSWTQDSLYDSGSGPYKKGYLSLGDSKPDTGGVTKLLGRFYPFSGLEDNDMPEGSLPLKVWNELKPGGKSTNLIDWAKWYWLKKVFHERRGKMYNAAVGMQGFYGDRGYTPYDLMNFNMNKVKFTPPSGRTTGRGNENYQYEDPANWQFTDPVYDFNNPDAWRNSKNGGYLPILEKGGYMIGSSHSNGGIPIEVEGGEYVLSKKAVDAIGVANLDKLNFGGGVLLDVPKFPTGGVVVGRRDYDPLLAQAITEQYRNTDLQGGTYDQIQAVYNALEGTNLSQDTAATLTEIFGTPDGFWNQISFDNITDEGITNSIIDGISDVFDEGSGGTGGSYPTTVVSEEMYLYYMTKPLDAVIVNTGNYLEYMTAPLPTNVYSSPYLEAIFTPIYAMGEIESDQDYLDRLFYPTEYVTVSSEAITDQFILLLSNVVINSDDFSAIVLSKVEETIPSTLSDEDYLNRIFLPIDGLSLDSTVFTSKYGDLLNSVTIDNSIITSTVSDLFSSISFSNENIEASFNSLFSSFVPDNSVINTLIGQLISSFVVDNDVISSALSSIFTGIELDSENLNTSIQQIFSSFVADSSKINDTISSLISNYLLNNELFNQSISDKIGEFVLDNNLLNSELISLFNSFLLDNTLLNSTISGKLSEIEIDQTVANNAINDLILSISFDSVRITNSLLSLIDGILLDNDLINQSIYLKFSEINVNQDSANSAIELVISSIIFDNSQVTNALVGIIDLIQLNEDLINSSISSKFSEIVIDQENANFSINDVISSIVIENSQITDSFSGLLDSISLNHQELNDALVAKIGEISVDQSNINESLNELISSISIDSASITSTFGGVLDNVLISNQSITDSISGIIDLVTLDNSLISDSLSERVSLISLDSNKFNNEFIGLIGNLILDDELFSSSFSSIISAVNLSDDLVTSSISSIIESVDVDDQLISSAFSSILSAVSIAIDAFDSAFESIVIDPINYLNGIFKPIDNLNLAETDFLDRFMSIFENVDANKITSIFEGILYEIFDYSILTSAIDDLISNYSVGGEGIGQIDLSFGMTDLIEKLDELWASGLSVTDTTLDYLKGIGAISAEGILTNNSHIDDLWGKEKTYGLDVKESNISTLWSGGLNVFDSDIFDLLESGILIENPVLDYLKEKEEGDGLNVRDLNIVELWASGLNVSVDGLDELWASGLNVINSSMTSDYMEMLKGVFDSSNVVVASIGDDFATSLYDQVYKATKQAHLDTLTDVKYVQMEVIGDPAYEKLVEALNASVEYQIENTPAPPAPAPAPTGGGSGGAGNQGNQDYDPTLLGMFAPKGSPQRNILDEVFGGPLGSFIDKNTDTLNNIRDLDLSKDVEDLWNRVVPSELGDFDPGIIYGNIKDNLGEKEGQILDVFTTGMIQQGLDVMASMYGFPSVDTGMGVFGPAGFLLGYESANPGSLPQGLSNAQASYSNIKNFDLTTEDFADDFVGIENIGNMIKNPRDWLQNDILGIEEDLDFLGRSPLAGFDIRKQFADVQTYDIQGTDIEDAINNIGPSIRHHLNQIPMLEEDIYRTRDELNERFGFDLSDLDLGTPNWKQIEDWFPKEIEEPNWEQLEDWLPKDVDLGRPNWEQLEDWMPKDVDLGQPNTEQFRDWSAENAGKEWEGIKNAMKVNAENLINTDWIDQDNLQFEQLNQNFTKNLQGDYSDALNIGGSDFGLGMDTWELGSINTNQNFLSGISGDYNLSLSNVGLQFNEDLLNTENLLNSSNNETLAAMSLGISSFLSSVATQAVTGLTTQIPGMEAGFLPNPLYKNNLVSGTLREEKNLLKLMMAEKTVKGEMGETSEKKEGKALGGLLFQRGGYAIGPSHAQGGMPGIVAGTTPIEFEGGEYIINKKTVALLGDRFFDLINSVKSGKDISGLFMDGDKVSLTGNNVLNRSVGLPGWVAGLANAVFGFSKAKLDMNLFSPSSFGLSRKNGGLIFAGGDKVDSYFPTNQIPLIDAGPKKLDYNLAARYGLLRENGGVVKKFFIGDVVNAGKRAVQMLSPPSMDISAGLKGSGSYTDWGFHWEDGGYLSPISSSGISSSNYGFGIATSVSESSNLNAYLLRELIQTLKDKDLSVTVVDENGNKKDESMIQIKRKSQLEYRNATELV